jgi:hypothetical protein
MAPDGDALWRWRASPRLAAADVLEVLERVAQGVTGLRPGLQPHRAEALLRQLASQGWCVEAAPWSAGHRQVRVQVGSHTFMLSVRLAVEPELVGLNQVT